MDSTSYDKKQIRQQLKKNAKAVLHRDLWGNIGLAIPWIMVIYFSTFYSSWIGDGADKPTLLIILSPFIMLIGFIIAIYTNYVEVYQSIYQLRHTTDALARPIHAWFKVYLTKNWQKILWLSLWMVLLYLIGWAVLQYIGYTLAGTGMFIVFLDSISQNSMPEAYMGVAFALIIIGLIIYFIFSVIYIMKYYKYILVPYVGYDEPSMAGFQLILHSRKLMNGHRWELFVAQLSFFWWILLTIVTLGLASFYTIPYMRLTIAGYFDLLQEQIQKQETTNNTVIQTIKPIILQPSSSVDEDTTD